MSHRLKNLNQKYYVALGIGIALIFLIIIFTPYIYRLDPFILIRVPGATVALCLLIIALAIIVRKTFTAKSYKIIIILLIGAIIATSINLLFDYYTFFMNIIVIVVCVVVLAFSIMLKKKYEEKLETYVPMSSEKKNLNQNRYIALGIVIALIILIIELILHEIYRIFFYLWFFIRLAGPIVALCLLIIALVKIVSKTFTPYVYKTIIMLLIGAIIATSISLIFFLYLFIIVIVACVVVLGYTLKVKNEEEARPQEEISPQHKIAKPEYNIPMILFAVGGGLIIIGSVVAIYSLTGLGGLGVSISGLNSFSGYILLGLLVGPPIIFLIVPGYFIVRFAYKKYETSKR